MTYGYANGYDTPRRTGVLPTNAFTAVKNLIVANARDVNILMIGDSTGDTTSEWIYKFFDALTISSHSIVYHPWDDTGGVYTTPVTLFTGTGVNTLHIWNASVGGSRGVYFLGTKYANAVVATEPDLVIFNTGINNSAAGNQTLIRSELMSVYAQIQRSFPEAAFAAVLQNPNRDSTVITSVVAAWEDIAALRPGLTLVDTHARFLALDKASSLYTDAIHPNTTTGTQLYVDAAIAAWSRGYRGDHTPDAPWFDTEGADLLLNGDFALFSGAAPDNWTKTANLTSVKELTIIDPLGNPGWSVKLTDAGGSAFSRLTQTLGTTPRDTIRGQTITIAARVYIPANMPQGAGRLAFAFSSVSMGTTTHTTRTETTGRDGWRDIILAGIPVPTDATSPVVSLYYDSAIPSVANSVYWGRAAMFVGLVPKSPS